jgi:malate dehydrogenase (oxaloacetate-decarboxylating)(NADP+)
MDRRMARDPIVFALANPMPEDHARPGAGRCATTRSSPPGGATTRTRSTTSSASVHLPRRLDARATTVNEEMKMAATRALALLAREDVPESVAALYGSRR